jgi:hypothetical protein
LTSSLVDNSKALHHSKGFCYQIFMPQERKRPRGRPAQGPHIGLRLPQSVIDSVDAWSRRHAAGSRSEAIRRLINAGLKRGKPKPQKMGFAPAKLRLPNAAHVSLLHFDPRRALSAGQ